MVLKTDPQRKRKRDTIYFSCNDEKLKRNIRFIDSNFLNIPFNKENYEALNEEQKKKVRYINDSYTLPIDFLTGFHNGTVGIVRTAPSTNIKTINELPYITELQPLPKQLLDQLELVTDKTLTTMNKINNGEYVPPIYTDHQIEKVKNYIKYLDPNRFNNKKNNRATQKNRTGRG